MHIRHVVLLVLVAAIPCVGATAAAAQDAARGQITVTVADSSGGRVAGASVVAARGTERRTTTTGTDGVARLANLGEGMWTITVTTAGFDRWQQEVTVGAGAIDVAATLAVAGLSETVRVESDAAPSTQVPLNAVASGGTRLELAVRDLPASLLMVGQQLIQDRGARSVEEAVQLGVGMIASTGVGSIPSYQTRGWSSSNVAVMRDGIRQNTASQSSRPVDSFILDRIEILKGPASLLYGEGSIGGAVNMVSKSPMSELNVTSLLSYGSFGSYRAGIGVNVPIKKNLFARVDLSRTGTDGYVQGSPQQLNAAAAAVRWLATPNVSIAGRATYTYDNTSSYYATPFVDGGFDPRMRDINYNMEDRLTKSHNRWAQAEADVILGGGWTLHNQLFAATHKLDWRNFEGYSFNPTTQLVDVSSYFLIWRDDLLLGNRFDAKKMFMLGDRALHVLVGAEAQRNDMERAGTPPGTNIRRSLDPFNPEPHFDPGLQYARQRDVLINTRALFSEAVYDVTDRMKLVGGLRWEQIGLDYTPYPSLETASTDYTPTTGRIGVVYELTEAANVYGSYSRAVEPTTQLVSLDGSQQQFSLVPGRQFEVGAKGSAMGGRLEGTFAYFDIEKRDLLITSIIDGIRTNQQVGKQSSRGIELAIVGRPTATLSIAGDIALTGARFDDFVEIVGGENLSRSGNTPPGVPRVLWNLSPTQRIGRFDLTGTIRQVGERWGDNANSRRVDAYTTVDAAVAYRLGTGSRITVRGRNLTDRIYTQSTSNTAARLEPPRAFDVSFTTDF